MLSYQRLSISGYFRNNLDEVCGEDVVDVLQPGHHGCQGVQLLDQHRVIQPRGIASVLPRLNVYFMYLNVFC